ncbi:type VI secretion system contractile sheath small subunit, partial [Salmonella enterica subsp. enterica serovar Bareilly]|nr:type VI secretion system contractile sheath small subunit [Salmonella enterica subsp. enterica serovar Bareilly]
MAMNAQHKRVNKNRVSITYDVEVNGESENRELPFVVGVVGDFSGHKPADKKCAPEDREFTG